MVRFLSARGFDYHRGRFAEVLQRGCVSKDGDGVLPGRFQGVHGGFAVVDLEATGSSSRRNRVVGGAVVLLDAELTVEGEFSTLSDPEGPVAPTLSHGIWHP